MESVIDAKTLKDLLKSLKDIALDGDREAARYLVDRVLGRPTESVDLTSQGDKMSVEVYIPSRRPRDDANDGK